MAGDFEEGVSLQSRSPGGLAHALSFDGCAARGRPVRTSCFCAKEEGGKLRRNSAGASSPAPILVQAGHTEPAPANLPANEEMQRRLDQSEDLRRAREEMHRFWMNNQPNVLTYEKLPSPCEPVPTCKSVTKVYSVADLVVPLPMAGTPMGQLAQPPKTCEAQLIEKITTAVEPKSWTKAGGKGSIDYFPIGMALVVNHDATIQAKVEQFLEKLRQVQDQQVTNELRVITVSDHWFAKSGLAKGLTPTTESLTCYKLLTPAVATKLIAACKEDLEANSLASPNITCLNGQPGRVQVGEIEHFVTGISIGYVNGQATYTPKNVAYNLGLDMTLEPTVSADGKSIVLGVNGCLREHGVLPVPSTSVTTLFSQPPVGKSPGDPSPLSQAIQAPQIVTRTIHGRATMPTGCTVLVYGGKATIETTVEQRLPMLSDVPHLAELFHKTEKQSKTNHLLVFVTSRIVSPDLIEVEYVEKAKSNPKLAKLLGEYGNACRNGKIEDARRLAIECLAIDPMCFAKK